MIYIFRIALMAVLSRMAGGGLGAKYLDKKGKGAGRMPINLTALPEVFFGAVFGLAIYAASDSVLLSLVAAVWSYVWMQTGHGVVLPWGNTYADGPFKDEILAGRRQTLSPVVDFLARLLKIPTTYPDGVYHVNYCRLFMAVKGFLIGLPVGGVVLAVLWPLGYEVGKRYKNAELCEYLSGAGAGVAVSIFLALVA